MLLLSILYQIHLRNAIIQSDSKWKRIQSFVPPFLLSLVRSVVGLLQDRLAAKSTVGNQRPALNRRTWNGRMRCFGFGLLLQLSLAWCDLIEPLMLQNGACAQWCRLPVGMFVRIVRCFLRVKERVCLALVVLCVAIWPFTSGLRFLSCATTSGKQSHIACIARAFSNIIVKDNS